MEAGHRYQYKSNAHNIQLSTASHTFLNNLKIGYKNIICKITGPSKVMKFKQKKEYTHLTKSNWNWAVEKIHIQCCKGWFIRYLFPNYFSVIVSAHRSVDLDH